jgi:hypothetical protein
MNRSAWLLGCIALSGASALAAPAPLSDDELADVEGRDGVSLAVHLELNSALLDGAAIDSRLLAGFGVDGTTTYAIVHNLAGVMDLVALTFDVRSRPDGGGDVLDIGLPSFVGFRQFGFRALAASTDPNVPVTPANSYGSLLLHGTASMTGHVVLWAQ